MIIREKTEKDIEQINNVVESAVSTLRETYRPDKAAIANKNKIKSQLKMLVAEIDRIIAGTVEYRIENNQLHITGLSVHHLYRKKGVAGKLIDALTEIAIQNRVYTLSLYTIKETGNTSIFEKLGFQTTSEEIVTSFQSDKYKVLHETHMEKEINITGDNYGKTLSE